MSSLVKYSRYTIILILSGLVCSLSATLEVGHSSTESIGNKAIIKLSIKINFKQPLKAARAWVVLMDGEGKIVGQRAQWLGKKSKSADEHETHINLPADETDEASIVINTTREAKDAKLTFSRIILEDGSMPDPRKSLVKPKK